MIYPSADLLENWGSKYALVALAARRAKQIKAGAFPLIPTNSRNALTIALEEIAAGKVKCEVADTDLVLAVAEEPEVAQLLAIPERAEEEAEAAVEIAAGLEKDLVIHPEGEQEESQAVAVEHDDLEDWTEAEDDEEEEVSDLASIVGLDKDEEEDIHEGVDANPLAIIEEEEVAPKRRGRKPKAASEESEDDLEIEDIDVESIEEIETIELEAADEDEEDEEEI